MSIDSYSFPRSWYEGLIARGRGDEVEAMRAFGETEKIVRAEVESWPDDGETQVMMGLVEAALGRKKEAMACGRRAIESLPISKDAYDGPALATNLAAIYAQVGEQDLAIELLASLVSVPNGPTPGLLRVEPEWDSLRGDAAIPENGDGLAGHWWIGLSERDERRRPRASPGRSHTTMARPPKDLESALALAYLERARGTRP